MKNAALKVAFIQIAYVEHVLVCSVLNYLSISMHDMNKTMGVYLIINEVNLKIYVGKGYVESDGSCKRWQDHIKPSRRSKPINITLIQRAIQKYGVDNFTFGWIESERSDGAALLLEQKWIAFWKTNVHQYGFDFGYNQTDGGEGTKGLKRTDENKERLRRAKESKYFPPPPEIEAIRRAKISQKLKGRKNGPRSDEEKANIAKGIQSMSSEARARQDAARKNKSPTSDEGRANLSVALKAAHARKPSWRNQD